MLVLSRKLDEVIRIGNDIEITVLAVKGNTVRLGIKAPRDVKVLRAELPVNPTQATVIAIVDSPEAADQQVFVGKASGSEVCQSVFVTPGNAEARIPQSQQALQSSHGSESSSVRLARGSSSARTGSLRDYLRDHHNSTAV